MTNPDRYRSLAPYYAGQMRCGDCSTRSTIVLIPEDELADHDAWHDAQAIARATGSVGATVTHERRLADGTLVTEAQATYTRPAPGWDRDTEGDYRWTPAELSAMDAPEPEDRGAYLRPDEI